MNNKTKYVKPAVFSLGTMAQITRAVKEQPVADAIGLTQISSTPGEPPITGS